MRQAFGSGGAFPYSPAIRAGDFVFVSGQVPTGPDGVLVAGGIEAQARATLDNLGEVLALAGCGLTDVVKVTVFLDDARDFGRFNDVYAEYFDNPPPARSTVCAQIVVDAKVEIEAVAYSPVGEGARK
jgi:2-iminobutanoate/2-iminopropanoate deaminase